MPAAARFPLQACGHPVPPPRASLTPDSGGLWPPLQACGHPLPLTPNSGFKPALSQPQRASADQPRDVPNQPENPAGEHIPRRACHHGARAQPPGSKREPLQRALPTPPCCARTSSLSHAAAAAACCCRLLGLAQEAAGGVGEGGRVHEKQKSVT